jgi:hypothetical protein
MHSHELRKFKVFKFVLHRTVQINHQPDATIFQFIVLTFIYSSTGFGSFPAHHQELNDCSGSLWFYLRIVVTVVCVRCRAGRLTPPTTHSNRFQLFHDNSRQQYGVTVTRCCSHSCFVLLKMGDSETQNM